MGNIAEDNYLKKELYALIKTDESIFDFIQESSLDGLWYWDLEKPENEWMNPKFWRVLGYNPEEMPHKSSAWQNIINQEDLHLAIDNFIKHCENPNHPYDQIVRYTHNNGSIVWIRCRGVAIRDANGKPVRMLGAHQDITDSKTIEKLLLEKNDEIEAQNEEFSQINEELNQTNNELVDANSRIEETKIRLELAIEVGEHGFWDWNLITNNTYFSPSYYTMLGYADKELPMSLDTFILLIHVDDAKIVMPIVQDSIESGKPYEVEFRLKCKDGSYKWILGKGKSYRNDALGKPNRAVGVHIDIHDRKKLLDELKKAKENAEESDRLKTAFLQNMSHEIRTPMNAIMGFSSLLPDNFNDKMKLLQFSQIIEQRCGDLLEIISDILDISKIESGQSAVKIEDCNIIELCSELKSFFIDYKNRIKKQHIELLFSSSIDESIEYIKTDKVKLKQILINLISNAFKFTEQGKIECGCKPDGGKLQFYVKDNGVGIPEDKIDYIFERFSQIKSSSVQNIGGTGLGLPIVKGLVDLLGGKVWVQTECYKGTTFFFTIDYVPLAVSSNSVIKSASIIDEVAINKTILIVEDDVYNSMYLQEILQKYVSAIFSVGNGKDAIEYTLNNAVDLVLMDVRLPDITGYEATTEILKHKPDLKIIAQTAYAANDEFQKALSYGCVDYISKPTKQEQLLKLINTYLKK